MSVQQNASEFKVRYKGNKKTTYLVTRGLWKITYFVPRGLWFLLLKTIQIHLHSYYLNTLPPFIIHFKNNFSKKQKGHFLCV